MTTTPKTYAPTKPAADVPHIELTPVQSSQLAAIGWDPDTSTLAIRFPDRGSKPGGLYHYADFGQEDWAALCQAESKGSHFLRNIKGAGDRFPCHRIVESDPA